jgi:hypothetical protein
MSDLPDVRHFGYRNPRYPFPKVVSLEIPQEVSFQLAAARGVDISVDGIAVAADTSFDLNKPVILVIPLPDGSATRVPGRVLCQSKSHWRFSFEFATDEQRAQIEKLISGFADSSVGATP